MAQKSTNFSSYMTVVNGEPMLCSGSSVYRNFLVATDFANPTLLLQHLFVLIRRESVGYFEDVLPFGISHPLRTLSPVGLDFFVVAWSAFASVNPASGLRGATRPRKVTYRLDMLTDRT